MIRIKLPDFLYFFAWSMRHLIHITFFLMILKKRFYAKIKCVYQPINDAFDNINSSSIF